MRAASAPPAAPTEFYIEYAHMIESRHANERIVSNLFVLPLRLLLLQLPLNSTQCMHIRSSHVARMGWLRLVGSLKL